MTSSRCSWAKRLEITGAMEGLLIGVAVGLGTWLALGRSPRRAAAIGALTGA